MFICICWVEEDLTGRQVDTKRPNLLEKAPLHGGCRGKYPRWYNVELSDIVKPRRLERNLDHKDCSLPAILAPKNRLDFEISGRAHTRITHDRDVVERNDLGIIGVKNRN